MHAASANSPNHLDLWPGYEGDKGSRSAIRPPSSRASLCAYAGSTLPEAAELRAVCQLNLASCCLHVGRNADAISLCNLVLEGDAANWKALYRRGQAHAAMGEMDYAVPVLEAALAAAPPDKAAAVTEKLEDVRRIAAQRARDEVRLGGAAVHRSGWNRLTAEVQVWADGELAPADCKRLYGASWMAVPPRYSIGAT